MNDENDEKKEWVEIAECTLALVVPGGALVHHTGGGLTFVPDVEIKITRARTGDGAFGESAQGHLVEPNKDYR